MARPVDQQATAGFAVEVFGVRRGLPGTERRGANVVGLILCCEGTRRSICAESAHINTDDAARLS